MSRIFSVEQFKSALREGGARPNQFRVVFNFPSIVTDGVIAGQQSQFLVNLAELPGQTINPAIVLYRGREVKFAGDRVYAPWTTTILNDVDFTIRTGIEQWMAAMDGMANKRGVVNPTDYQADLTVEQLDRNGEVLKQYILRDAFPIDLSPVALDYSANDQISSFTCTWQYQSFAASRVAENT